MLEKSSKGVLGTSNEDRGSANKNSSLALHKN